MSRPTNPPVSPPMDDDPATLRARLEKRYTRPERPCTYDPADEEPEAEPVAIHNPDPACRCVDCRVALGEIVRYTPPEEPGTFPGVGRWPTTWTGTTDAVSPWPESQRFEAQYPAGDWTPHTCPTVDTSRDAMRVEALRRPFEFRESSISLRSYLRTLTNPDATPEDVNGALDALTPEDRALVSEALPSWGSARMSRVEAIAPFMNRFETMVRERDPRAKEEGTLLLSALLEDDPTRSTAEALMEIAKTPKVNP